MDSVFSPLTATESPLVGFEDQPAPEANINNLTANRTARLAAFVTTPPADPTMEYQQNVEAQTQKYYDEIKTYGDESIRHTVAANEQAQRVQNLISYNNSHDDSTDPDGSIRAGAQAAAQASLSEDISNKAKYALEQASINKIQDMAGTDPAQAKVLLNNLEDGDTNHVIRDFNTKQLILQREIENAGIAHDSQSIVADFADFVLGMGQSIIPFTRGDIGNVDLDSAATHWYDSLLSGNRKQAEGSNLWNMPVEQFSDYVKDHLIPNIQSNSTFLGYHNNSEAVDTLTQLARPDAKSSQNLMDTINNVGLVAGFKPLGIATSIPSLLVRNGARSQASKLVANAMREALTEGTEVAASKTGVTADDMVRAASPTALNVDGIATSTIPIATDVNTAFARGQALLESISNLVQPGRMTEQEFQQILAKNAKAIDEQFGAKSWVKDVIPEKFKTASGQELTNLSVTLGRKGGGLFTTAEEAEGFARSLNLPKGYTIEEVPYPRVEGSPEDELAKSVMDWESLADDSGQFGIKFKTPMKETGFYTNPLAPRAKNALSRFLINGRKISDEWLMDIAQTSANTKLRITKALKSKMESINSLNQNELTSLGQLMELGSNETKWYTDAQMTSAYQRAFNREPTVREFTAYHDARDLNDMEYVLRNDALFAEKHLKGYQTVSVKTGNAGVDRLNGLVDRELKSVPKDRVWDDVSGKHWTSSDPLTTEKLDELRGQGAVMVKLEQPMQLNDGTTVRNLLVRNNDVEIESLRRDQIGYREGGHRIYSGKHFAKQAKEVVQPDGTRQLVNPHVYTVGETRAEMAAWVQTMETARIAVRSGADETILDKLFKGNPGFPSGKEFMDGVSSGKYSLEHAFEVTGDRELPSTYREATANLEFVDPDQTGINGLLEAQGRLYYSGKGEALRDFKGDLAPTLDPYATLNQSLSNIAKLTSFADYKQTAVERWATTFRKYTNMPQEASDWVVFSKSDIGRDVPERLRQGALAQRDVIRNIVGYKTDWDYQKEQMGKALADWIGGEDPNSVLRQSLSKGVNWWNTKDISSSIRGLVFDKTMGFWNPVQVPLNLGNMYAAITLSPQHGLNAMKNTWFLKSFLTKSGSEEWLSHMVSNGTWKKLGFDSAEEFKTFYSHTKNSGVMNIGDSNIIVNSYGPNASLSALSNKIDQTREAGRTLLHWTWEKNKMVAQYLAWKDLRGKFPEADFKSQEFLNKLAGRTEEYDFNFSKESQAAWQRGWTAIPTQFFGYWASMVDAMFGKQFTVQQRIRLAAGQVFLAGTAGFPLLGAADAFYTNHTGDNAHPDKFWGGLRRGALDEIIYGMTGADVQAGARIGVGNGMEDLIEGMFGFSNGYQKSWVDVMGGASASTIKNVGKTFADVAKYVSLRSGGADDGPIAKDTFLRLAANISTLSNLTKAYSIFKYGTLKSANGNVIATDVPTVDGFAQAIGFAPEEQNYISHLSEYNKNNKAPLQDAVKTIEAYDLRFLTEPDNRADIGKELNAFIQLLPEEIRMQALRKAHQRAPKAFYQSLTDQIKRDQQQKALILGTQEGQE